MGFTLAALGLFGVLIAALTPFSIGDLLARAPELVEPGPPADARDRGSIAPDQNELDGEAITTLLIFIAAVLGWAVTKVDDTFIALCAAAAMVATGTLEADELFAPLGSEPIWLLVAAFVLSSGISNTALPARLATMLAGWAHSPRQLMHCLTAGLVVTALLIPSTSGRAALVLPVFHALAAAYPGHTRLVRVLALLFPTVVLLSAIATLTGAGAHLITSQILENTLDEGISFAMWLVWGVPLAVISSHLAAELVLVLFTRGRDRRQRLAVDVGQLRERTRVPERIQRDEIRALALLGIVVALWSTEPWHEVSPGVVALIGALLITSPRFGTTRLGTAIVEVPWSLLLFMAATTALGTALTSSGAAGWLAWLVLGTSATTVLISVIGVSVVAHLVIQSRSARSSVLIPLVIPAALGAGLNPTALAFTSTAAAGFCHTLPSSAKPLTIFVRDEGPTFNQRDLVKLSALLGPMLAALVLLFATMVWPWWGLPLS